MRSEVRMDVSRLITEVYKRPALWNQKNISYHNREATNRIWSEISTVLKLPKQLLKSKWKGLRDTFRAEIKKDLAYRRTKLPRTRSSWVHYKSLQFLREQMLPRPPVWERVECTGGGGSYESCENSGGEDGRALTRTVLRRRSNNTRIVAAAADTTRGASRKDCARAETNAESVMTSLMMLDGGSAANEDENSIGDESSLERDAANDSTLAVKIEPPEHCEVDINESVCDRATPNSAPILPGETPHHSGGLNGAGPLGCSTGNRYDDNYFFFVSLLPHIRSLPPERRMLLRMRMQQLVYDEVYDKKSAATPSADERSRVVGSPKSPRNSASPRRDKRP